MSAHYIRNTRFILPLLFPPPSSRALVAEFVQHALHLDQELLHQTLSSSPSSAAAADTRRVDVDVGVSVSLVFPDAAVAKAAAAIVVGPVHLRAEQGGGGDVVAALALALDPEFVGRSVVLGIVVVDLTGSNDSNRTY